MKIQFPSPVVAGRATHLRATQIDANRIHHDVQAAILNPQGQQNLFRVTGSPKPHSNDNPSISGVRKPAMTTIQNDPHQAVIGALLLLEAIYGGLHPRNVTSKLTLKKRLHRRVNGKEG